jgi:hypothetical protein
MALLVSLTQVERRRRWGGCVARFTHYRVGRHVYAAVGTLAAVTVRS